MKFHAPTGQFTVATKDIEYAAHLFMNAIKNIREAAGLPLTKYSRDSCLEPPDFAMKSIIDGAKAIGIDLGAEWGNEIDVSGV